MHAVTIKLSINAPRDVVLKEFADYTHAPILHRKHVKSVRELERFYNVSTALWRIKILGVWSSAIQKQTVFPPGRLVNETITGIASGTMEDTCLSERSGGTNIVDTIEVRTRGWARPLERIVAAYARAIAEEILLDYKRDLESRFSAEENR
ncbi:MAG TPA: hypothetical protein VMB24_04825 [Dehalococcoidales bacterium]|nr:hypothetical protein [Dehalococcoidales bacterium]